MIKKLNKLVFFTFLFLLFLTKISPVFAATYNWSQTDWSGGADESSSANHSSNRTDWTKYYSKDSGLQVDSGSVTLGVVSEGTTFTSTNFSVGTTSGIAINGSNQLQLATFNGSRQISAGDAHSCAVTSGGDVYCWGKNNFGQVGIGSTTEAPLPFQVLGAGGTGFLTDIIDVSAGGTHTCALKSDYTVWCWGDNTKGQLGRNNTTASYYPVQVLGPSGSGFLTDIIQLSAGGSTVSQHTCAVKSNGTAWCWGSNTQGVLGNNSTTAQFNVPVQVVGLGGTGTLTDVVQIEAGKYVDTCARKSDGTIYCWGFNTAGQLGNNTTVGSIYPVQVLDATGSSAFTGATDISVGTYHVCAVQDTGNVYCWGANSSYQLGTLRTDSQILLPTLVRTDTNISLTDIYDISVGSQSACGIKTDTTVWCWGVGDYGSIAQNNTTDYNKAIQAHGVWNNGLLSNTTDISSGASHVCAITSNYVSCWGLGSSSQLGLAATWNALSPVTTMSPPGVGGLDNITQVSIGYDFGCGLKSTGTALCWGKNTKGQLGINTITSASLPDSVLDSSGTGPLTDVAQISASNHSGEYVCFRKNDGSLLCDGENSVGQLGINSTVEKRLPTYVVGLGGTGRFTDAVDVSLGSNHTCALKTDGTAWCWGYNNYGQLGNSSVGTTALYPRQVQGLGGTGALTGVNQISTGSSFSCAVKTDGTAWCWGYNNVGQLGNNSTVASTTPVQVLGLGGTGFLTDITQITGGADHVCARKSDGTAYCWGGGTVGQLGRASTSNSSFPVQVTGLTDVSQVSVSNSRSCAVKADGTAWCWGYSYLGNGTSSTAASPVRIVGPAAIGYFSGASSIEAGYSQTCLLKDSAVWCFGQGTNYALGNGATIRFTYPTHVLDKNVAWDFRLSGYYAQGSVISNTIDLSKSVNLTNFSLAKSISTNTAVKIQLRSADTEEGLTTANWIGSSGVDTYYTDNLSDISSTTLNRYLQYKVLLETSNTSNTPTLTNFALDYQSYPSSSFLISSPFDSEVNENLISQISWIKSTPTGSSVKFQLRSASNLAGLSSSEWQGTDGTSSTYFTNNLGQLSNSSLRDGLNDRWVQYKMILDSNGLVAPTVYDSTVTYVVNAPPQFDTTYQTSGFGITRSSTPGIFNFLYKIRDIDTDQGSTENQFKLWPTFQYTLDNGGTWTTITPDQLAGSTSDNPVTLSDNSTYVESATVWDATDSLPNTYGTMKIRVIIDDHEAANNTATVTSDSFVFDTKLPIVGNVDGGGVGININHNVTTSLAIDKTNNRNATLYFNATDDSDLKIRYSTDENFTGVEYQDYISSIGYTLPSSDGSKRIYVQYKDTYNNETIKYSDVIQLDTTAPEDDVLFLQDITNPISNEARLFINWPKSTNTDWMGYKIYQSENGGDFSFWQTIDNINTNYILKEGLTTGNTYGFKVTQIDDLSNESIGSTASQTIGGNPTDAIPPTITNIQLSNKTSSSVTISWTTNEVANSTVLYSVDNNFGSTSGDTGYSRNHTITLSGLSAGTTYNFKVRSSDASGNAADSTADDFTTNEADDTGPVITSVISQEISLSRATITFNTDELASSFVEYSTTSGFTNGQITGQNESVISHSVVLKSLTPATTYYYKARSVDKSGNQSQSEEKSFTTLADTSDSTEPSISGVSVTNIAYNTATINFTTNELSSSFVEFGKDSSYGRIYGRDDSVTSHSIALPYDLKPETVYYYRVRTKDLSSNESFGVGSSFVTANDPHDLVSPVISAVDTQEPQQNSVTISWTTDEVSTSFVGYSEDLSYTQEQGDSVMTRNHSVTLVGLKPKTVYYLRIKSVDPSGNYVFDNNSSQGYKIVTADGENLPSISSNQIKNVTTKSADIYWETDLDTNSYVEYGLDTSYGNWAGLNNSAKSHTVSLDNLISGITYNFRVRSSTAAGAEAVSQNFTLTTQGVANTEPSTDPVEEDDDISDDTIIDKIKNGTTDLVKKVLDIIPDTSLSEGDFIEKMNSMAPKIVSSPSISSSNITVDPGVDKITISWTTDKKSNSVVAYVTESEYDATKTDPYTTVIGNPDESVTNHSVIINNLNPNTTYHYEVRSKSDFGNWTDSPDFTFTTLSINSEVRDLRFTKVGEKSVTVNWATTFESRAMVEAVDVLSNKTIVKSEEKGFGRSHEFSTDQLQTSTNYRLKIITVAKDGTISEESVYPFSTSTSSNPPEISNVRISNALISGAVEQVQTIISWKTDKPSTSRIIYGEGSSKELTQSTSLDKSLVTDHIVVTTNLKPGKVYKFKVESVDSAQNISTSKDFIIMTPKPQESVINLIIDNFTSSFSFITKGKK